MVDFDYDKEGSKTVAQLVRSLIYFLLVGMQQELAFTFSSVKVSNFIKVLQHILVALLLIEIIGEFTLSITKEKSSIRNPLNNEKSSSIHERKVEPLLKKSETKISISSSADRDTKTTIENNVQSEEKENELKPEPKILISSSADRYMDEIYEQPEEKENVLKPEPKILISSSVIDWIMGNKSTFIRTLFLIDYTSLILFIILLGFLLNDLKEIITRNFVIALAISFSLTFIVQSTILIVANRGSKFNQVYYKIFPKYHAYITIVIDMTITNVVYFPSLINYFLLQTPDIFNKIFLNVSALFVSSLVMHMYKIILKNEEMEKKGGKVDEGRKGSEDYV
ncbi:unnamed protein product [Rhizophagus irregularis]|uniref:Uncharacterized protein n=1 Tax=Rhizophagus irregularis TaxID=588596 RepID=A0A2N1NFZ6_9GLOM|nr:hypothetical protein RhiirC2_776784 [Rhizophagus irregularis]CAB5365741.1 unnamed protein product [Rhizophagus irregularis]